MNRFYDALASWWPVLSPPEDYAGEAAELGSRLRERRPRARTLLELGSGGGHLASHLRGAFDCTLTDRSPAMLEVSRRLNPGCAHHPGDLRTLRLDHTFDLVLAHDAIDYMTTEDDLRAAFATARHHLAPGGLALFVPDHVAEAYEPGTDVSGSDAPDGRSARLFEWSLPPGPDGTVDVHYLFALREPDGAVHTEAERHVIGLFPRHTWERLLAEAGFTVEVVVERTDEDHTPRLLFFGHLGAP
ncbi:MAG: class I SAM-dependent methyltransferase [Myxococcota bacterium]